MEQQVFSDESQSLRPARPVAPAMWRGFLGRCPQCGEGRLFGSWLKTVHACDHCGQVLDQHRADDFPAYLVIVIVGHIVVTAFHHKGSWKNKIGHLRIAKCASHIEVGHFPFYTMHKAARIMCINHLSCPVAEIPGAY